MSPMIQFQHKNPQLNLTHNHLKRPHPKEKNTKENNQATSKVFHWKRGRAKVPMQSLREDSLVTDFLDTGFEYYSNGQCIELKGRDTCTMPSNRPDATSANKFITTRWPWHQLAVVDCRAGESPFPGLSMEVEAVLETLWPIQGFAEQTNSARSRKPASFVEW